MVLSDFLNLLMSVMSCRLAGKALQAARPAQLKALSPS